MGYPPATTVDAGVLGRVKNVVTREGIATKV